MGKISIDNGYSYVTPAEALRGVEWEVIVHYMDDDIRETVHAQLAPCTNLAFLTKYLELSETPLIIG
ncbi:hypothetical protein FDG96_gp12 [Bacillus phage Mgbh1]|uniref:AcrIC5-like domain-containing protein n=1 Tax=Bacillus phage Mgbh1 TaxID=1796993 RepID=A0A142F1L4_9CAUD|nr:hypothetical protein FDG96_gp12 [Bacillus phage Mgbh1]AMQ66671.1 hypothetical protein [Bacillus phage Mgbh1]